MYTYRTRGVCSHSIDIELSEDGSVLESVVFHGGCEGNLKAISKLVKGMKTEDVTRLLEGNSCGYKPTSCADQLVKGIYEAQNALKN